VSVLAVHNRSDDRELAAEFSYNTATLTIPVMLASVNAAPWFATWNYSVLESLFRAFPHHQGRDEVLKAIVHYPFPCTFIFALVFLVLWTKNDDQRPHRRICLFRTVVALGFAVIITLILRPWVAWPAPGRNVSLRILFPRYLWGEGSSNSFPSHSTLAYFMVSIGIWPISRKVSVALAAWTLAFISFPRLYLGGHYPIDVVFSVVLGLMIIVGIWNWPIISAAGDWLILESRQTRFRNALLSLWIIELGDGFRGAEFLAKMTVRLASRI
jgi:undecaprenyl-diphosphatase